MASASPIKIIRYSEKAGAVLGETRPIKDSLKATCKWSKGLTVGGLKTGGWIFPWARLAEVEKAAGVLAAGGAAAQPPAAAAASSSSSAAAGGGGGGGEPSDLELFSSASGAFLVVGKTWEKKEMLKAAGGVWQAGWLFPAAAHDAVLKIMASPPPQKEGGAKKRKREGEGAEEGEGGGGGGGGGGGEGSPPSNGE
jgi:hypothetical protein